VKPCENSHMINTKRKRVVVHTPHTHAFHVLPVIIM
jgi:hypothetical protein